MLHGDVFIIDDRALWEADNYEAGDIDSFRTQLQSNYDLGTLEQLLSTHKVKRTTADLGYIIFHP